ncbi:DUF3826 domain-containing protein [Flectobacillus sp. BAB-3569]|uniref:DUF3826 domain-containing protein n=1 Tax=Flectobacillus sp. BAB-3569 TaxID=1509483 RepID=UPI000BA3E7A0|nr:DUF3826 domain-containing protein [Flectobacillus sp. BAB-3569]PAC28887.1 hypothetical protein BWI92_17820 [Flectobacillus sp. BAB-3569]
MIQFRLLSITALLLGFVLLGNAQNAQDISAKEAAYTKTITDRADKIVQKLEVKKEKKALKVRDIIANQYRNLNDIHEQKKNSILALKSNTSFNKEQLTAEIQKVEQKTEADQNILHEKYIKSLSKQLSDTQVEAVKDGMTYNVLPNTYKAYQEMLPDLTKEQKKQILDYLTEAREHAMDAETSEKKHAWFGKYKGKINNYLSAQGVDMKKAGQEWEKKIKAAESAKKEANKTSGQ